MRHGAPFLAPLFLWAGLLAVVSACGGPRTSLPTTAPAAVRLGEQTQITQISLTVNSAERRELIGEASPPGAGNVFVVIEVHVDNQTDHKISYTRYQFSLRDPSGGSYEPAAVPGQERPLLASELEAKKDVTGTIVFRVPQSAGPFELVYQPPGSPFPLRVDLGSG